MNILLSKLSPHPLNRQFDQCGEKWQAMVGSVREHGVIQRPMVRPQGKGYEIVFGHRRVAAAQEVGIKKMECDIREIDDRMVLELLVIENLERENPDPVEEGKLLRALVAEGVDVTVLAHRLKRSVDWITTRQRLLDLGDEVLEAVRKPKEESGHLDMGTVRVILQVAESERARAIQLVLHPEWTTEALGQREAESVIKSVILEPARKKAAWEKECPGLVKAWKKALAAYLTKEQKQDLIVQALRYDEWETCKLKTRADDLIPYERRVPSDQINTRWVELAIFHGLPVWVIPGDGNSESEMSAAVVDERLIVMAETARLEHGLPVTLLTGKAEKTRGAKEREQRIAAAVSEIEGGGDPHFKDEEPIGPVATPAREEGKKIEQSFNHSAMIDMGAVKRLAMWAVSTDSDTMDAPAWVPKWAKELAIEGQWPVIDEVCNWVSGLKA